MKRIMGYMLAVTLMLAGFGVQAQNPYGVSGDITVAAGVTTNYTDVVLDDLGRGVYFRELDEFIFLNASGTATGTVTVSSVDIGVTTQVYNAGIHIPGYSTVSYPRRAQEVQTWAGFVVTGNVAIAKSTVVTRNDPYMAKRLLIKITQPASATANVYKYSIRAK